MVNYYLHCFPACDPVFSFSFFNFCFVLLLSLILLKLMAIRSRLWYFRICFSFIKFYFLVYDFSIGNLIHLFNAKSSRLAKNSKIYVNILFLFPFIKETNKIISFSFINVFNKKKEAKSMYQIDSDFVKKI